jgi:hypothetical protein
MTTRSIADPLAESYITVVHRLLDESTRVAELTAENAELKAEIARRDAYQSVVTSVVNEAFAAEALDAEADAYGLPAFPVAFPNRFPIYDKWSDVPDGVRYASVDDDYSISTWVNRDGRRLLVTPTGERPSKNDFGEMCRLAPFVEVV